MIMIIWFARVTYPNFSPMLVFAADQFVSLSALSRYVILIRTVEVMYDIGLSQPFQLLAEEWIEYGIKL